MRPPDGQFMKNLFEDLKSWEETLNQEAEHFTGETLLSREEELYHMNKEVDGWTDVALKVNNKQTNKQTNKQMNREMGGWTDVTLKVNNNKQTNR